MNPDMIYIAPMKDKLWNLCLSVYLERFRGREVVHKPQWLNCRHKLDKEEMSVNTSSFISPKNAFFYIDKGTFN